MKASELRNREIADLNILLLDKLKEQFNLRMQRATGQLARPDQLRKVRRDIARSKTVINEKKAGKSS
mgnify:FL=1